MNSTIRLNLLLVMCLFAGTLFAQDKKDIKFGRVTAADFNITSPVIDSNVNAVVLADVGVSKIEGNNKGWFSIVYNRVRRIKILNKKAFDAADVSIGLYTASDGREEKLSECKAITYNLENGEVKQTKLESSNIFKEKKGKRVLIRRFTFPNVKEGSILEYTYTIESDFLFNLQPWDFQGQYPRVYTQYTVKIPQFLVYVFLAQGYFPLKVEKKERFQTYSISESGGTSATEHYSISGYENETKWTAENVPALKEEPFTSSLKNHESKVEFQLSQYRFPNVPVKDVMGNWKTASDELMKSEAFGSEITRPNTWLNDEIKTITAGAASEKEKAYKLYNYVRDNFTATSSPTYYMMDGNTLRDVFRKKSGTASEVNLLLIAMLRNAGIGADPVLISTRNNGFAHPFYPLMDKYNLTLVEAVIYGHRILLDATEPRVGFGKLSPACYNGSGFVVRSLPGHLILTADSLKEAKSTLVFIVNDDKTKGMTGNFSTNLGYYESTRLREKLAKSNIDEYLKETEKGYSYPMKFEEKKADSLDKYDFPVSIKYKMNMNFEDEDIVYFNPMFSEGTKNNPFKSAERKYPVEMPYRMSEIYVLNMEIPKGYKVDELPKSVRVMLNDDEGTFEYIVNATPERVMLRSKIDIKKANFEPGDYQTLRDFFGHITKKHGEQIVFKKAP